MIALSDWSSTTRADYDAASWSTRASTKVVEPLESRGTMPCHSIWHLAASKVTLCDTASLHGDCNLQCKCHVMGLQLLP